MLTIIILTIFLIVKIYSEARMSAWIYPRVAQIYPQDVFLDKYVFKQAVKVHIIWFTSFPQLLWFNSTEDQNGICLATFMYKTVVQEGFSNVWNFNAGRLIL